MRAPTEPTQRAAYAAESAALGWQATRTACLLSIVLIPCFGVLDHVVFPAHARLFLALRGVWVAGVGVVFWLLHTPWGRTRGLGLGVVVAGGVGLLIDVMTMVTGAETSPYYAGTNLVLLAVALLMPWRPSWTLGVAAVLVGGYVAPIVAAGRVTDGRMLANNLFFLLSTAMIAVISTALRERLRGREFATRTALVAALRHKSDFMARMSHELRTPIHVMIGYTDILLDDALPADAPEARGLVGRIREHGVLLHRLISDLLDYAKEEAGKLEVHPESTVAAEMVEHIADRFRPVAERKGLAFRAVSARDLPPVVTDRQRLEQILTNLIGNAIKFTDQGSVTVGVRRASEADRDAFTDLTCVEASDAEEPRPGAELILLVEDTGIGIRAADLTRLASDFEQIDETTAARYGGTGLGLSISRKLARRLGGRLAVQSRHGQGSTFAVFLPLAAVPAVAAPFPRAAIGV